MLRMTPKTSICYAGVLIILCFRCCDLRLSLGLFEDNAGEVWPSIFWMQFFKTVFDEGKIHFCNYPSSNLMLTISDKLIGHESQNVTDCHQSQSEQYQLDTLSLEIARNSVMPWFLQLCPHTLANFTTSVRLGEVVFKEMPCAGFPYGDDQEMKLLVLRAGRSKKLALATTPEGARTVNVSLLVAQKRVPTWMFVLADSADPVFSMHYILTTLNWTTFCVAIQKDGQFKNMVSILLSMASASATHDLLAVNSRAYAHVEMTQNCDRPAVIEPLALGVVNTNKITTSVVTSHTLTPNEDVNVTAKETLEAAQSREEIMKSIEEHLMATSENGVLIVLCIFFILCVPLGVVYMNWPNRNCL